MLFFQLEAGVISPNVKDTLILQSVTLNNLFVQGEQKFQSNYDYREFSNKILAFLLTK